MQDIDLPKRMPSIFWRIPMIAILAVTPLIVFLAVRSVPPIYRNFWIADANYDFFSFYKTRWFIFWSLLLLISFLYHLFRQQTQFSDFIQRTKYYWILSSIFAFSVLISALFSKAYPIAWWGMFDRYEGAWVWFGYCLLFVACAFLLRKDMDFKLVSGAIVFSTTIIAVIGAFQFFEMDIFRSNFGHFLILPEKYPFAVLNFTMEKGKIYSTFFNTNYGGNIAGMALPPAVYLCLNIRKIHVGTVFLSLYALLMFILAIGCRSRSGVFGISVALMFLAIYLFRHDRRQIIRLFSILALSVPCYLFMDWFSGGEIGKYFTDKLLMDQAAFAIITKGYEYLKDICTSYAVVIAIMIILALPIIRLVYRHQIKSRNLFLLFILSSSLVIGVKLNAGEDTRIPPTNTIRHDDSSIPTSAPPLLNENEEQRRLSLLHAANKSFFDKLIVTYGLIGSGRGYIYLRSLDERLKHNMLFGTGPDTFAVFFPRNDAYRLFGGCPDTMLIDKVHSMFLQIWFNTGLIAFLSFMILISIHFLYSARIFWKRRVQSFIEIVGFCCFLGWTGFLGASIFNDSAISISPYFWAVFGTSVAANYAIQRPISTPKPVVATKDTRRKKGSI